MSKKEIISTVSLPFPDGLMRKKMQQVFACFKQNLNFKHEFLSSLNSSANKMLQKNEPRKQNKGKKKVLSDSLVLVLWYLLTLYSAD